MSLLQPTLGETWDRLTIIALKMESGNHSDHLVVEQEALLNLLRQSTFPIEDGVRATQAAQQLAAVNAFIWHKEDEIRTRGAAIGKPEGVAVTELAGIAELAVEIRKLADRRHHLIAEIDRIFGDPRAGKEKSWMEEQPTPARVLVNQMRCPRCFDLVYRAALGQVMCRADSCGLRWEDSEAKKAWENRGGA